MHLDSPSNNGVLTASMLPFCGHPPKMVSLYPISRENLNAPDWANASNVATILIGAPKKSSLPLGRKTMWKMLSSKWKTPIESVSLLPFTGLTKSYVFMPSIAFWHSRWVLCSTQGCPGRYQTLHTGALRTTFRYKRDNYSPSPWKQIRSWTSKGRISFVRT